LGYIRRLWIRKTAIVKQFALLFLPLLVLGYNVSSSHGQDNSPIVMRYTIEADVRINQIDLENVLRDVQARLREFDVDVIFEEVPFSQRRAHRCVILSIFAALDGKLVSWASAANPEISQLSPILYSSFPVPIDFSDDNVDRLTAMILYQLNFTEAAENIFLSYLPPLGTAFTQEYFYMGNIKILQEDYESALNYFNHTRSNGSDDARRASINMAWIFWQQGDTNAAMNLLNRLLSYERVNGHVGIETELVATRASFFALNFDYTSALEDMNTAIELAEENNFSNDFLARLYTQRGEIILLIYEWDRALENFDAAIQLKPDYAPAHFQRGVLLYTLAQREGAMQSFEQYLHLAPNGQQADDAQSYLESINNELEALGN